MFTIYTQPDCPWCDKAKDFLLQRGAGVGVMEVASLTPERREKFKAEYKTVPQVFLSEVVAGERQLVHIGGYQDLVRWWAERHGDTMLIKRLSPTAVMPTRGSAEAIAVDLHANLGIGEEMHLLHGEVAKIPTGWAIQAPKNCYLRIAPRSGLALKGIDTLAGVIDRDYTGEITVVLTNHHHVAFTIRHGERIAQAICERAVIATIVETDALPETARGAGGFGSTGR